MKHTLIMRPVAIGLSLVLTAVTLGQGTTFARVVPAASASPTQASALLTNLKTHVSYRLTITHRDTMSVVNGRTIHHMGFGVQVPSHLLANRAVAINRVVPMNSGTVAASAWDSSYGVYAYLEEDWTDNSGVDPHYFGVAVSAWRGYWNRQDSSIAMTNGYLRAGVNGHTSTGGWDYNVVTQGYFTPINYQWKTLVPPWHNDYVQLQIAPTAAYQCGRTSVYLNRGGSSWYLAFDVCDPRGKSLGSF